MARIVIFGVKEAARLACAYLRLDTTYEPVAYTVTKDYLPQERVLDDLPIVPFEMIASSYSPAEHSFLVPMSYRDHNRHRARIFGQVKALGYTMGTYVSPRAVVCPGLQIGENSMILEGCIVSPGCVIGNNVMIQAGCVISHGVRIGDHAFLGPGTVLSGLVDVGPYAFIGSGGRVRDRVRLGEGSFIAMGSVVRSDTEPWVHYDGMPARLWDATCTSIDRT
ncbi:MAG: acetyltransferase [Kiritimatiellae bacterium]|nr:acetyltransferase [Kiritimatiellia bacterium]MDD5521887.1 acetyltransferase [Kiritimatiellia bacterium]